MTRPPVNRKYIETEEEHVARKTFRHRNRVGGHSWLSQDLIFTFWVGQRVVRTGDRRNYHDEVVETGVVKALPGTDGDYLKIRVEGDDRETQWSVGECRPLREHILVQARRFESVGKDYRKALKRFDENGFEK